MRVKSICLFLRNFYKSLVQSFTVWESCGRTRPSNNNISFKKSFKKVKCISKINAVVCLFKKNQIKAKTICTKYMCIKYTVKSYQAIAYIYL